MRNKKSIAGVLGLLLMFSALSLNIFANENSKEPVVYSDNFDYTGFGKSIGFYTNGAWETEYIDLSSADDFGYRDSTSPTVFNGVLHFKEGDGVRLNWQKLDGFSSFDASKTYTISFDVTLIDLGDNICIDGVDAWNRDFYFAPAGYYNQIEIRSGDASDNRMNYGIRAGNTWVDVNSIAADKVYHCSIVWIPADGMITTTVMDGSNTVATGSRTSDDYKTLNKYTRSWVWRCEDGQIEVDNISFSDGTDSYTQDFNVDPGSMIENGIWDIEDVRVTNALSPELEGGRLKLSTQTGVKFNWMQVLGVSPYSATNTYTFEFDLKVTDKGNGNIWVGTRSLYVGFGGWYTVLSMLDQDNNIVVCNGGGSTPWADAQHLGTNLHATFTWSGNSIYGHITDENGNVVVSGSRENAVFTDMTVEKAAMTNLVLRCEDGAVEIDNFKFTEEKPAILDCREISAEQTVYSAEMEYSGQGCLAVNLGEKSLFTITPYAFNLCSKGVNGLSGAGAYNIKATVNRVQQLVSVELTTADGEIVRRSFYQLLEENNISSISVVTTNSANKLKKSDVSFSSVAPNHYTLAESEPAYSGVEENIYNVVTSFDEAQTTRNFAWTANASFVENSAMALKYRVKGTSEWTEADGVKETEMFTVPEEAYFKCDISGLTADTEYEYKIGIKDSANEGEQWSKVYSFKTAPEQISDFSFIAVGDTQGMSWSSFKFAKAAHDEAVKAAGDPAFFIHTGDVVELGGEENLWNLYFKALGEYGTQTPFFATNGNHDIWMTKKSGALAYDGNFLFDLHFNHPNNGGTAALGFSEFEGVDSQLIKDMAENADETIYSYNYGDAHFISLNSGIYDHASDPALLRAQYDWLKADLEAHKDAKWTIIFQHQPVYHRLGGQQDRGNGIYNDLIEEYGVALVLHGHSHLVTRSYPMKNGEIVTKTAGDTILKGTGTVYTTIGSTSTSHDGISDVSHVEEMFVVAIPTAEQAAYTVVDVAEDDLVVTTKQLNGLVLDRFTITSSDNDGDDDAVTETPTPVPVKITSQPKTTYTKSGSNTKVTVKAAGDGLAYTWYYKNASAEKFSKSSIKTATYSVKMSSRVKNRQVYCVVKDKYGKTVKSNTVTLRMAATITTQPETTYTKSGSNTKVTVKAAGDGLTYTWYYKNAGAEKFSKSSIKTAIYSVKMSSTVKNRQVYCVIKDKYGNTVKTKTVTLKMK